MRSRKVETKYKIVQDSDTVAQKCEKRQMTFRKIDFGTVPEITTNVTLDIEMFRCPLTRMDLKFLKGDIDLELEDFYVTEGTDLITFGVLHNSTSCGNVCLTNLFKIKLSTKPIDEFLEKEKDNIENMRHNGTWGWFILFVEARGSKSLAHFERENNYMNGWNKEKILGRQEPIL